MMPISTADITKTFFASDSFLALSSLALSGPGYRDVRVQDLRNAQGQGALILDVRTPEEYSQEHVQGAKLLPPSDLPQRTAEVPASKTVYLFCHSGRRSAQASQILVRAGKQDIPDVQGGMAAWERAGDLVVYTGGQP
ncbi:MAG: rhodanese-like domain-containing protein [Deinococcus sp.]